LRKDVLKDILKENLKIIFVGSAASDISASEGHYYANPQNCFWKLLYEAGLTDRQLSPKDDSVLMSYGFGLTDVVKSEHGSDSKLSKELLVEGRKPLEAKIRKFRPRVVCFTSKNSYRAFFGYEAKSYGLQPPIGGLPSNVFIVPSPSPQVMPDRCFDGKIRLQWFKELAEFVKSQ
jgi:TDG/mug DNA glycosylase family protein